MWGLPGDIAGAELAVSFSSVEGASESPWGWGHQAGWATVRPGGVPKPLAPEHFPPSVATGTKALAMVFVAGLTLSDSLSS